VHAALTKSIHGEGVHEYILFEPDEPRPESAPVVVYLHGWGATSPKAYGAWIDHIVRRGNVVVFPRYQKLITPMDRFTPNAARAIREALETLDGEGHVNPRRDELALVGHSMGGVISANLAALATEEKLPPVRAVFAVQPGITETEERGRFIWLADLSKIPADTLLLSMAGDVDGITGSRDARRIYLESTSVPAENKDYLILRTDYHGIPRLRANHMAPVAFDARFARGAPYHTDPDRLDQWGIDALDWYGLWKPFDALCDAAFRGENRDIALGNTPEQRDMGKWSDGRVVRTLLVRDLR